MPKPKVLAPVMAGGEGSRLELLTDRRAKPAVPFAGVFRLIDLPLSNCVHSGIEDVWVLQQYRLQSLDDELANGRPWDLDRTYGGLRLLSPQLGSGEQDGFHEGNADAIWRNRQLIAEHDPEVVLVLSADHVYRLDYGEVLARHRDRGAGVTVVTTEVPAFETGRLLATLDELAAGDGELKDFGPPPAPPHGRRGRGGGAPHGRVLARRRHRPRPLAGPHGPARPGAPAVRDVVLLDDCVVAAGARVERAVLDRGVRVGREARVGGAGDDGEPALVAETTQVPPGATVAPGGRLGPDGAEAPAV
jgi:ADP-glucose pyrophosphorylase